MITEPTVLILGAGASMHLGFPSGVDLKDLICGELHKGASSNLVKDLNRYGFSEEMQQEFGAALTKSGRRSVDRFLEHRPDFVEIGKAAIARTLMVLEYEPKLFSGQGDSHHWYELMFDKVFPNFEPLAENLLSVITFNYDRSLEHYLITSLRNSFEASDMGAAKVLNSLPILHVHGQLGQLPSVVGTGRHYSPNNSQENLKLATEGIRIVHEVETDDEVFGQARAMILNADRIIFIGFGYDRTNLIRLGFPDISVEDRPRKIYGSAFEFTTKEMDLVKPRLFSNTSYHRSILVMEQERGKALDFVREHALFG